MKLVISLKKNREPGRGGRMCPCFAFVKEVDVEGWGWGPGQGPSVGSDAQTRWDHISSPHPTGGGKSCKAWLAHPSPESFIFANLQKTPPPIPLPISRWVQLGRLRLTGNASELESAGAWLGK